MDFLLWALREAARPQIARKQSHNSTDRMFCHVLTFRVAGRMAARVVFALLIGACLALLARAAPDTTTTTTSTGTSTSTSTIKTSTTTTTRLPQSYALDPCNVTFNLALRVAQTTATKCTALNNLGTCLESQILGSLKCICNNC